MRRSAESPYSAWSSAWQRRCLFTRAGSAFWRAIFSRRRAISACRSSASACLYQEGYFRQMIDAAGWQQEAYPYNEPSDDADPAGAGQGWRLAAHRASNCRAANSALRVWRALVGRTTLYLLDSNDPLNGPVDRGITGKLYGGGDEMRLLQEIVLGIGGWRAIEAVEPESRSAISTKGMRPSRCSNGRDRSRSVWALPSGKALWATRAGNVFTTHTAGAGGL